MNKGQGQAVNMVSPLKNAEVKDVLVGNLWSSHSILDWKWGKDDATGKALQPPTPLRQKKCLAHFSSSASQDLVFYNHCTKFRRGLCSLHKLQLQWDQSYTNGSYQHKRDPARGKRTAKILKSCSISTLHEANSRFLETKTQLLEDNGVEPHPPKTFWKHKLHVLKHKLLDAPASCSLT